MIVVMGDGSGWVTEEEMIEVDRVMVHDLGIELIQMMENAGRELAELALERYEPSSVVVCAGSGGNGGGGLVAARHLANQGVTVSVTLTRGDVAGVPGHQLSILRRMGVPIVDDPPDPELWIDAVIGYSLRDAPRGRAAKLIDRMKGSVSPVLSLDVPSGVDATTGATPGAAVIADATLTLAAPTTGLRGSASVGALFVADLSVPPSVFEALGHPAPVFGARET